MAAQGSPKEILIRGLESALEFVRTQPEADLKVPEAYFWNIKTEAVYNIETPDLDDLTLGDPEHHLEDLEDFLTDDDGSWTTLEWTGRLIVLITDAHYLT